MKVSTLMWVVLTVAVGVSMFLLKYKVQASEEELIAKQEQIARDHGALRVLEAEWAYFNDPERLRRLSAEHLEFVSPSPNHVKTIAALPYREGLAPPPENNEIDAAPLMQSASKNFVHERFDPTAVASAQKHLSGGSVFFAHIQRYLIPARAEVPSMTGGTP